MGYGEEGRGSSGTFPPFELSTSKKQSRNTQQSRKIQQFSKKKRILIFKLCNLDSVFPTPYLLPEATHHPGFCCQGLSQLRAVQKRTPPLRALACQPSCGGSFGPCAVAGCPFSRPRGVPRAKNSGLQTGHLCWGSYG